MAGTDPFVARILKLLTPLGPVEARRMFGGHGFYLEGTIFAIVFEGTLWLKADDETKASFEKLGLGPMTYEGRRGQTIAMPYWEAPKKLLKDGKALCRWAKDAYDAGVRFNARKAPKRKKATARDSEASEPATIRSSRRRHYEPDF